MQLKQQWQWWSGWKGKVSGRSEHVLAPVTSRARKLPLMLDCEGLRNVQMAKRFGCAQDRLTSDGQGPRGGLVGHSPLSQIFRSSETPFYS